MAVSLKWEGGEYRPQYSIMLFMHAPDDSFDTGRTSNWATVPRRSGECRSVVLHGQRGGVVNFPEYIYTIKMFPVPGGELVQGV